MTGLIYGLLSASKGLEVGVWLRRAKAGHILGIRMIGSGSWDSFVDFTVIPKRHIDGVRRGTISPTSKRRPSMKTLN